MSTYEPVLVKVFDHSCFYQIQEWQDTPYDLPYYTIRILDNCDGSPGELLLHWDEHHLESLEDAQYQGWVIAMQQCEDLAIADPNQVSRWMDSDKSIGVVLRRSQLETMPGEWQYEFLELLKQLIKKHGIDPKLIRWGFGDADAE